MTDGVQVDEVRQLSSEQTDRVRRLVDDAADRDGVSALSEHVLLHLRTGGDADVRHVLASTPSAGLVGYAHIDVTDAVAGSSAELVVHPEHRGRGIGAELAERAIAASPDGRLRLWAHGEHPAAAALAQRMGFVKARELWQLRRSLLAPLPTADLAPGVDIRTFVPGADEAAWTDLNNRAFAEHPEQGRWTEAEIRLREQEPWFDPAGFFLAERDGSLIGFHWTKVHGGGESHAHDDAPEHRQEHGHEPIGEVYVVGVDPDARGLGLGRSLTLIGLRHLRAGGLTQAMLYVDESNRAAVSLYDSLGFVHWSTDISYVRHG